MGKLTVDKVFSALTSALFLIAIFSAPILTKLQKNTTYSLFENRNLASAPELSIASIFEPDFAKTWDNYVSDQFWERNSILSAHASINANILKRPVVNGVVVNADDSVLLPYNNYVTNLSSISQNAERMSDNLSTLNKAIQSYGGRFIYAGVPEQKSIYRDLYPTWLENWDDLLSETEEAFFTGLEDHGIEYVNMRERFLASEDWTRFYSKIDTHFNLAGAIYTYQTVMDRLGIPSMEDFELVELENPFYGARNRRLFNSAKVEDKLTYAVLSEPVPFGRKNNNKETTPSVFGMPYSSEAPLAYTFYMGGDIALTEIDTNRDWLPNLLVFGDSFTNAVETIIYTSFNRTVSLDLRHYHEMSLIDYISGYKPDYVICIRDDTTYLSFDGNGSDYTKKTG
ncbi:MAG: hypothetical protein LBT59_10510 [Clostridiales bacterium]|jgi:hypothetical protein|nr:hypothetical protein [Clostridiales bacterium]